jgi:hypothetical protein
VLAELHAEGPPVALGDEGLAGRRVAEADVGIGDDVDRGVVGERLRPGETKPFSGSIASNISPIEASAESPTLPDTAALPPTDCFSAPEIEVRAFAWLRASEKMFCQLSESSALPLMFDRCCIARIARFGTMLTSARSTASSLSA